MLRLPASLLLLAALASAHDIPSDVTVHMLLDSAPPSARLLLRVPLSSLRDIDYNASDLTPQLRLAATQWLAQPIELYANGNRLAPRIAAFRLSLPSDRSFDSFPAALAHVTASASPPGAPLEQLFFDLLLEYPLPSSNPALSLRPGLHHLAAFTTTALVFSSPSHPTRAFQFHNDPGLVPLDPRWHQAASRFLTLGFEHILDGADHLLFLACLVLPFRRLRELVLIVTAFTLAHSVTLIASAYGMAPSALWFPPFVETLIAVSILYMALENIAAIPSTLTVPSLSRRWLAAFGFGLIHGFGFSFALRESLQFAGAHLVTSLLSFNLGVELGQLLVVAALVPLVSLAFRYALAERTGILLASALIAHTAWHWTADRFSALRQYPITLPDLSLSTALRWLLLLWLAAGAIYLLARRLRPRPSTLP